MLVSRGSHSRDGLFEIVRTNKMSKVMNDLVRRNPDKARDWYKDSDGYWLQLKRGWQSEPHSYCHGLHTETVQEMVREFRWVAPCDCDQCKGET